MAATFISLKKAAEMIGRSVARCRQYRKEGKFGAQGVGWQRDEFGHILISEEAVKAFVPPERGNARAAGIQSATTLRHFRAAKTWILAHIKESDRRLIWLEITNAVIAKLADLAVAEKAALGTAEVAADVVSEAVGLVETEAEVEEALDEEFDDLVIDL